MDMTAQYEALLICLESTLTNMMDDRIPGCIQKVLARLHVKVTAKKGKLVSHRMLGLTLAVCIVESVDGLGPARERISA